MKRRSGDHEGDDVGFAAEAEDGGVRADAEGEVFAGPGMGAAMTKMVSTRRGLSGTSV